MRNYFVTMDEEVIFENISSQEEAVKKGLMLMRKNNKCVLNIGIGRYKRYNKYTLLPICFYL